MRRNRRRRRRRPSGDYINFTNISHMNEKGTNKETRKVRQGVAAIKL